MDGASNRVTKLYLRIAHAMSANHGTAGFHHLGKSAGQDLLQDAEITVIRETYKGQRAQRPAPHGVNVAQGIGGSDLAEGVRIIDDGGEEIDRLDQRLGS